MKSNSNKIKQCKKTIKNSRKTRKSRKTKIKYTIKIILKTTIILCLLTAAITSSCTPYLLKNTQYTTFNTLSNSSNNNKSQTPNIQNNTQETLLSQNFFSDTEDLQTIISKLGANGYTAVDSKNQINMTNPDQVYAFCQAAKLQKKGELTIIVITYNNCFHIYEFETQNGNIEIIHSSYEYQNETIYHINTIHYPADFWQYTEEGYLVFEGSCFSDIYYLIEFSDMSEKNALRVAPLDQKCRELNQKYILPIGYERNNLFLTNWNENHFGDLEFYDLFDRFYPLIYHQESPYIMDVNSSNGTVYQIPKEEFETVIMSFIQIDSDKLQSQTNTKESITTDTKTADLNTLDTKINNTNTSTVNSVANRQKNFVYLYRPRGFYDTEYPDIPYPEVVNYIQNADQTITLFVNAVYPNEHTSKAFSHKVVIRPFADGSFQYVSNEMITPKDIYETWWHSDRLTNAEWNELYGENAVLASSSQNSELEQINNNSRSNSTILKSEEQTSNLDITAYTDPIFENSCIDCVLSDSEKTALNEQALTAALQTKEVYQNIEINGNSRWESNITNFTKQQCQQIVLLLGEAGYTSVSDDINMENYQKVSDFYTAYQAEKDAEVTIFNVNPDGYIGAFTFIYRKEKLQTYYVGIGWQSGGNPLIQTISINDVAELKLTEKGYFIYTYAVTVAHASARQYWRIKPLSDQCRALTQKYITGLSYVNYNLLITDWNKNTVESILMPCMFADIYRKDTGKNLQIENTGIPAPLFEDIMTTYFPVSIEQLRAACGYDERTDTYLYEVIYAAPYPPFGEVVAYQEHADGTITLTVDGVWIDYNSDCAFTNKVVVQPFSDGSFRFLSNQITKKELDIPQITID